MKNQLLPTLAAATVALQGLVADTPRALNLDDIHGLKRGDPQPELVRRSPLCSLSAPGSAIPEVERRREALCSIERLEERGLIGSGMAQILRQKSGDPHAGVGEKERERIPSSLLTETNPSSIRYLEHAVLSFSKSAVGRTFPKPAIRAAVAIGFFTEGGIQGAVGYLAKVEQIASIADFRTHLETDKPYSIAWLHQRLKIFDSSEVRFLDIGEKVPRAESTLKAYYRNVANLPDPVLSHLSLRQVIAPENLLALASMGESKGYNTMNQGTSGGRIIGSTYQARELLGQDLTKMTIGRVLQLMEKGKLFAAGRFQIVPDTLKEVIAFAGLGPTDLFDKKSQDKLGVALLLNKRPSLGAYVQGDVPNTPTNKQEAQKLIGREWASIPVYKTGVSAYDGVGGNRADPRISVDFVGHVLSSAHYESRALAEARVSADTEGSTQGENPANIPR